MTTRRTLLITGGSGFLGTHLIEAAEPAGWRVVAPSSGAMDVTDTATVAGVMAEAEPDAVAHLAYRRDDRAVIVDGSRIVAEAAAAVGARLVQLSTDVVFPGGRAPYREVDPPDPVHDYGRWKAEAERVVMTAHSGAVLVRTSLLYGTRHLGPCQQAVLDALDDPDRMAFFTDEVRSFTHAGDLAEAILVLAARRDITGPLHVAGPEPMDRHAFAVRTAAGLGRSGLDLRAATVAGSGLDRPARVVLDSSSAAEFGIACRPVSRVLAST